MARFRVFVMGASHAPTVEIAADDLSHLGEIAKYSRFLEGEIVDSLEDGPCRVLIPMGRIQMIAEA